MIRHYKLACTALVLALTFPALGQTTLTFDATELALDTFVRASPRSPDTLLVYEDVAFPSSFDTTNGFWTGGWALSTSRNDSVGDFTNLYGAASGSGAGNSRGYLVGQEGASISLPRGTRLLNFSYSNLAYTAEAVGSGTQFSRAFGVDTAGNTGVADSLMLSVCGYAEGNPTFVKNFPLADFRGPDSTDFILDDWSLATSMGDSLDFEADSLLFRLLSSDAGSFGNNTPNFFVLDDFTVRFTTSSLSQSAAPLPPFSVP